MKDAWLINGLYDYYLSTNSANTIVVLVHIKEPHHQFLFDRLSDSIAKSSKNDVKVQALTLLGHVVRSQPTWLYKLSEHHLLKDILRLLKVNHIYSSSTCFQLRPSGLKSRILESNK